MDLCSSITGNCTLRGGFVYQGRSMYPPLVLSWALKGGGDTAVPSKPYPNLKMAANKGGELMDIP